MRYTFPYHICKSLKITIIFGRGIKKHALRAMGVYIGTAVLEGNLKVSQNAENCVYFFTVVPLLEKFKEIYHGGAQNFLYKVAYYSIICHKDIDM